MSLGSNREFVSRVVGELKALSKDGRISRRLVLSTGKDKARLLIGQKLDEMTLFREDSILSHIPCFEMCEIKVKDCGIFEFNLCESIMKSKHPLPFGVFGKNGAGIFYVSNTDQTIEYKYISPQRYSDLKKRKYARTNSHYYTIKDGHIFIPNSTNELIELHMIVLNQWEIPRVSKCRDLECKSYWDYDFVCPGRLYESVVTNTVQELAGVWANVVPDTNPNLDPNLRTKTTR